MDIGFYSYKMDGTCYSLGDDYSPGTYLSASRIFSALAIVFGGMATITAGVSICFEANVNERRYMGYIFIFSSALNATSLLILKSDICTKDFGDLEIDSNCEL